MPVDASAWFQHSSWLAEHGPNPYARGMEGSDILAIAQQIRGMIAKGADIANFSLGDFDPKVFPIPDALRDETQAALAAGHTNYPPAVGIPELRSAISSFYSARLDATWPAESMIVGSGARPPIYAAFRTLVAPGDVVLYPTPTWNCRYYVYLAQARGIAVQTSPERGFMPTAEELAPYLREARLLYLNSPLNPCGTAITPALLKDICTAIVAENDRRRALGERPLFLLYDMVYWQLVFGGGTHATPVGLVPEMAPYTLIVDAISKSWAATGLRVGWAAVPPALVDPMQSLIGHVGAWAGRAEQVATAKLLAQPARVDPYMTWMKGELERKLTALHSGLQALRAEGLPVDSVPARGAIYLSARFEVAGRRTRSGRVLDTDDAVRAWLLEEAGVAVVPFTAFGYAKGTGWVRFSVGASTDARIALAVDRLGTALRAL